MRSPDFARKIDRTRRRAETELPESALSGRQELRTAKTAAAWQVDGHVMAR